MNANILVVDDERSMRDSLSKLLASDNYNVLCAESGEEAIEKIGEAKIDLLLLDLGLPMNDGWATLKRLDDVNPLLPVVIITGRGNQREQAERAGADALMEKPLDVPRLLETIRGLIAEPMIARAQRARARPLGFRFVPCDSKLFNEMQLKRFTTPYRYAELKSK